MAVQEYHWRAGPRVASAMELDTLAHACSELLEPLEHQPTLSEPWDSGEHGASPADGHATARAGLAQGQLVVVFLPVTLP